MKTNINILIIALLVLSSSFYYVKGQNADIKVATFNIRMDTPKDGLNSWPNRKEFVKHLIQYHDFDIVGTQEGFIHQIEDILEIPEYTFYGKGRDDGKHNGEHSAIIYKKERFTLKDSGDFWLSETPDKPGLGWDATCCNRIASWVKLFDKKTQKEFFVFNVHFDHQGVIARRESGKLMIKKISEIAKNSPVILTGDFNSIPDSEQIIKLKAFLQDSYDVSKLPPYGPVGTTNSFEFTASLKNRIDYIFVSKQFNVLKYAVLTDFKDQRYPSDHMPVVSTISFN